MKKALLALPISLVVISTASCSWLFGGKKDLGYITYSPNNVMNRRINGDTHRITYKGFELSGDVAVEVIDRALETEYTYIKTVPEQSDNYFVLCVNLPALLGYNRVYITFYENGYAKTYKSGTYYYEFDKDLAKSLCDYVDDAYEAEQDKIRKEQEERDNVEREYNEMIESMTIYTIIDNMSEEENVSLEFYFVTDEEDPRFYDFTFKDDGSIYTALKGAQYSEFVMPETSTETITPAYVTIKGIGWSITVDKPSKSIHADYATHDRYYRSYSKSFVFSIDDDSLNTVLNRAYELSAPKNPFGENTSSSPSSSSSEE